MPKLITTLVGLFLVAVGGVVIVHYGKSWFGGGPGKVKIWIDKDGCHYEGNVISAKIGEVVNRLSPNSGESKENKEKNLCLKMLEGDIDGNKVEIDWERGTEQKDSEQYKNAKQKWDEKNKQNKS